MKKRLLPLAALFVMSSAPVLAQQGGFADPAASPESSRGGYTGPAAAPVHSVDRVMRMRDDSKVTLRGKIVQYLGGDKYLFRDDSGEIEIEIDDDDWNGAIVGPADLVEIHGEVDKDWNSVEIDVDRVIKLP